jgi:hypothetical protein
MKPEIAKILLVAKNPNTGKSSAIGFIPSMRHRALGVITISGSDGVDKNYVYFSDKLHKKNKINHENVAI